jgi:hypothetical protein
MPLPITDAPPKEHSLKRAGLARRRTRQPHPKDDHLKEGWRMIDFYAAKMWGHRRNIERYCRLLATELTDLERQYLSPGSERMDNLPKVHS